MSPEKHPDQWRRRYYLAMTALAVLAILLIVFMIIAVRAHAAASSPKWQLSLGVIVTDLQGRPLRQDVRLEVYRISNRYLSAGQRPVLAGHPDRRGYLQTQVAIPLNVNIHTPWDRIVRLP